MEPDMLHYEYECPIRKVTYDIRIAYRTEWSNDETHIRDGLVRVVDTSSNTEVYCSEHAIYAMDPEDYDAVLRFLMFEEPVLTPNPEIIRQEVFDAKRELQDDRRRWSEDLEKVRPLLDTYRTIRPDRADIEDPELLALVLQTISTAMHSWWALDRAQRIVTTWEQREAALRPPSSN